MTDIVDRLRDTTTYGTPGLCREAADEIEKLRGTVAKYEAQMDRIIRASQIGGPITFVPQGDS